MVKRMFGTLGFMSLALLLTTSACVHDPVHQAKLDEHERELLALRKQNDQLENKLSAVELRISALAKKVERVQRNDPPALNVVRLSPAQAVTADKAELDEYAPGAVDNGEPPIVIKLHGDHDRGQRRQRQQRSAADQDQGATQRRYDQARALYVKGAYQAASKAFDGILADQPKHSLADNAAYWSGMCFYDEGRYTQAIERLQKVAVHYPKSAKVPDAFFAIGKAYQALGDKVSARVFFAQVVQQYPAAEVRPEAEKALAQLDGGGQGK